MPRPRPGLRSEDMEAPSMKSSAPIGEADALGQMSRLGHTGPAGHFFSIRRDGTFRSGDRRTDQASAMTWIVAKIKWIMLVSGLLSCAALYVAVMPREGLRYLFDKTLTGALAQVVVRD